LTLTMDPLQRGTGLLPPALRALALGLLVETAVPLLGQPREGSAAPPRADESEGQGNAALRWAMHCKCGELSALVLQAEDPKEAAAYVLGYLPKHFKYLLEPVHGSPMTGTWGESPAP
jgi:hypothetical protein